MLHAQNETNPILVISWSAVRVGFITQLLWDRYGSFWEKLLKDAGAEIELPALPVVNRGTDYCGLQKIPSLIFRLAVVQAIDLRDVDLLIAPDLSEGIEANHGVGQDPWVAQFSETLQGVVGRLPPIVSVPVSLTPAIKGRAIQVLHHILQDAAGVRRVWERNQAYARQRWRQKCVQDSASTSHLVGVLGQPWVVGTKILRHLKSDSCGVLSQSSFDPQVLRREANNVEPKLLPSDLEVLGATRLFNRRGDVTRLIVVADRSSSDDWLLRFIQRNSHKPVESVLLEDLLD